MKKSLSALVVAVLVSSFAFQAYASSSVERERRAAADAAYWHNKSQSTSTNQQDRAAAGNSSQSNMQSGVSQYPCAHCVYDSNAGGYVDSPHLKR